jgi:prepilin-type processing-associated H-X9-DG protein
MRCSSNLEEIGVAVSAYIAEHPEGAITLDGLVELGYLEKGDLVCPSARDERPNYVLVPRLREEVGPAGRILAYEPLSNHGHGANVLFAGGKCKFIPKEQFQELVDSER